MGTPYIQYAQTSFLYDGPGGIKQYTQSFGATEFGGNLKKLVELYVSKKGKYAPELAAYTPRIGKTPSLTGDKKFIDLMQKASLEDQAMKDSQDELYERVYFEPAKKWAEKAGFVEPLSYLVVFDSFLQSGGILSFLRNRFPETLENEKEWIAAYSRTRLDWLSNHSNKAVKNSAYRMRDILRAVNSDDWKLAKPFIANGIKIP
jgi:chitosanase